ncbi:MAG: hypothetical protein ACRC3F_03900 [Billgrantia desiderata]
MISATAPSIGLSPPSRGSGIVVDGNVHWARFIPALAGIGLQAIAT